MESVFWFMLTMFAWAGGFVMSCALFQAGVQLFFPPWRCATLTERQLVLLQYFGVVDLLLLKYIVVYSSLVRFFTFWLVYTLRCMTSFYQIERIKTINKDDVDVDVTFRWFIYRWLNESYVVWPKGRCIEFTPEEDMWIKYSVKYSRLNTEFVEFYPKNQKGIFPPPSNQDYWNPPRSEMIEAYWALTKKSITPVVPESLQLLKQLGGPSQILCNDIKSYAKSSPHLFVIPSQKTNQT